MSVNLSSRISGLKLSPPGRPVLANGDSASGSVDEFIQLEEKETYVVDVEFIEQSGYDLDAVIYTTSPPLNNLIVATVVGKSTGGDKLKVMVPVTYAMANDISKLWDYIHLRQATPPPGWGDILRKKNDTGGKWPALTQQEKEYIKRNVIGGNYFDVYRSIFEDGPASGETMRCIMTGLFEGQPYDIAYTAETNTEIICSVDVFNKTSERMDVPYIRANQDLYGPGPKGYTLVDLRMLMSWPKVDETISNIEDDPNATWHQILEEGKRKQFYVSNPRPRDYSDDKTVERKTLLEDVSLRMDGFLRALGYVLPSQYPQDLVIIKSAEGCASQPMHSDFDFALLERVTPEQKPLGVIIAIQDGTRVNIQVPCNDMVAGVVQEIPIPPHYALLFLGDVQHGGAAYDEDNSRLHTYYLNHFTPGALDPNDPHTYTGQC